MSLLQNFVNVWALMIVSGLAVGGALIFAWFRGRLTWRWIIAFCVLALVVVFELVLPWAFPDATLSMGEMPELFRAHFWTWLLIFSLGAFFSVVFLVRAIIAAQPTSAEPVEGEVNGRFPEIDAAWDEIVVRLSQARVDASEQHVFLILAPDENAPAALVESAGLQVFAHAPDTESPIHAFATADGILLSVSGASAMGLQDVGGVNRLEYVCRKLLDLNPDRPIVRGVVVLFPLNWAGQADSIKWAASVRDDLRAIERTLLVSCPVFALFSEMETTPGFAEFLKRMSVAVRQSRCGFAVPPSNEFSGDLVQRGLIWMSRWFHGWTLSMMVEKLNDAAGNGELLTLDNEFRRYRKRMRGLLEAAFSTMRSTDPVQFRGCYFMATGQTTSQQAFAAGLFRGAGGRIIREHVATRWTLQAIEDDRTYRRRALMLGLGGAGLTLLGWSYIILQSGQPWWYLGLATLTGGWGYALNKILRWVM